MAIKNYFCIENTIKNKLIIIFYRRLNIKIFTSKQKFIIS
ncbi:hypothetical protein pb186bvf_009985 [Paramecium bursaria]